jgi:hypothetical protein
MKKSKVIGGLMALSVVAAGLVATSLIVPLTITTGSAQSTGQQPSAKVTAKVSNVTLIPPTTGTGDWVTLLCNNIKTPAQKDLFMTAALETGLFTSTGTPPEATARATVQVRVLRDGQQVEPGVVVYGHRAQLLRSDVPIELQLDTLDAASFSFVDVDVPVGVHQICVQARVTTGGSGEFEATGAIGKGTLTVESVRLIRGEDVLLVP